MPWILRIFAMICRVSVSGSVVYVSLVILCRRAAEYSLVCLSAMVQTHSVSVDTQARDSVSCVRFSTM